MATLTKFRNQFSASPTQKGLGMQIFNNKITFKMKGKDIVIRDYVQENADGTDFYKNLERFGNLQTTIEFMSVNRAELIEDFTEFTSRKNIEDKRNNLQDLFYRLPAEIRAKEFHNNFNEFEMKGQDFFEKQNKIIQEQKAIYEEQQRKAAANTQQQTQKANTTKETTAGAKSE